MKASFPLVMSFMFILIMFFMPIVIIKDEFFLSLIPQLLEHTNTDPFWKGVGVGSFCTLILMSIVGAARSWK